MTDLVLPFFIGAVFQGAYLAMYYASFRQVDDALPQHDALATGNRRDGCR